MIREPVQPTSHDEDYTTEKEPESEEDESLEGEEVQEQPLDNNHRELIHTPPERIEYRAWQVELSDELLEHMKYFGDKKMQDAFDDKDDDSKQLKSRKSIHLPSLEALAARESFTSYFHDIGFE